MPTPILVTPCARKVDSAEALPMPPDIADWMAEAIKEFNNRSCENVSRNAAAIAADYVRTGQPTRFVTFVQELLMSRQGGATKSTPYRNYLTAWATARAWGVWDGAPIGA